MTEQDQVAPEPEVQEQTSPYGEWVIGYTPDISMDLFTIRQCLIDQPSIYLHWRMTIANGCCKEVMVFVAIIYVLQN